MPNRRGSARGADETASLRVPVGSKDDITTLAHYYRGEVSRMISWRDRIDRTTNWAIGAVAAMLSISLASPAAHHGVLLFAMMLIFLLLHVEARRYRFFDVFRTRVRLLERNYYSEFFDPRDEPQALEWTAQLGESLRQPRFLVTRREAMARRLMRNYRWIFLILLAAWLLKVTTTAALPAAGEAEFVHSLVEFKANARIGSLPGAAVLTGVLAFYGWLAGLMVRHRKPRGEMSFGEVHF